MREPALLEDWFTTKLKNLPIEIIDGDRSARYPKRAEFQSEGVLFLNTTNIVENRLELSEANFVSPDKFAQMKKGRLRRSDIVMTTRGSVGKVALFDCKHPTGLINAQMLIVRSDGKAVDQKFLFYLLSSPLFQSKLRNFASGSAQPQIPIQDLREIEIALPRIKVQRKIAAILSAYDDLIENSKRRIRILEEMAQAIYREWFVHFRFPGHEKAKMVDSALGTIPHGWEVRHLGDVALEVRRGIDPGQVDPDTPYFGLEHLPRKSIALSEWGKASQVQSTKLAFKKGEILFGKIRPYFHKVGVAPVDGVCSSDTIVITPKSREHFSIVLACVSSEEFVNHATQTSQGTKMPRANWEVLAKYPVHIPPQSLLYRFNQVLGENVDQIQNLIFRNRNLRCTRDLLLPKLMSGEVDVADLDVNKGERI
jgi:type I restriction enzyme, S subunit